MVRAGLIAAIATLVLIPDAEAKFAVHLSIAPAQPRTGELATVRLRTGDTGDAPCTMRVVAVAPGASLVRALDALVIDRVRATPLGLRVRLRRGGATSWSGSVRFPRPGRWRVVVPNWCASGYAIPQPATRVVDVR